MQVQTPTKFVHQATIPGMSVWVEGRVSSPPRDSNTWVYFSFAGNAWFSFDAFAGGENNFVCFRFSQQNRETVHTKIILTTDADSGLQTHDYTLNARLFLGNYLRGILFDPPKDVKDHLLGARISSRLE